MRPRSALDLRKIRLAERSFHIPRLGFTRERPDHFLLRHLASQPAQRAFHQTQVPNFFTELHIAICNNNITNCDSVKRFSTRRANLFRLCRLNGKDRVGPHANKKAGRSLSRPSSFNCAMAIYGYDNAQPPAPLLKALLHNDCTAKVPVLSVMSADAP